MRFTYAFVCLALSSCGVLDFDVTQPIPQQMIPGDPVAAMAGQLISAGGVFPNPFSLNIDVMGQQQAHGTGPIDSIHMKALMLTIDPSSGTQNWDWLDNVHIYIASTKQGTTLPKVILGQIDPVPKGAKTLNLSVNPSVNLLPYINEGTAISSDAQGRVTANGVIFAGQVVVRVSPI